MVAIRRGIALLVGVALLLVLAGGALAGAAAVDVVDMMGRAVHLDAPAARVVALTASDVEILYALGAGGALVGRGAYCDYPPDALAVPAVQSGFETNYEEIIALAPDIVLMNTMNQTKEQAALLEAAGIAVVVSNAADIAGTYASIELIGSVLGKDAEAALLVGEMKAAFAEAVALAVDGGGSVYFEVSPLEWGLWTAGSGTFMDELARMLGLTNAFADVAGWGEVSEEQVIARDPDYIVTIAMYYGDGATPVQEIAGRAGWENMKAVRAGSIFNADSNEISRPGPRLVDALGALRGFIDGVAK